MSALSNHGLLGLLLERIRYGRGKHFVAGEQNGERKPAKGLK